MAYVIGLTLIVLSGILLRGHYQHLKTLLKDSDRLKWAIILDKFLLGPSFIYFVIGLIGLVVVFRGQLG